MNEKSFDSKRIEDGYLTDRGFMEQVRKDCHIDMLDNGLDVGCGAGIIFESVKEYLQMRHRD